MSDPRLTSDFQGQNAEFMTFPIDNSTITYSATVAKGSASVGKAVTFTSAGDGTIKLTEDAERVVGRLVLVTHDNYATVQVRGAMKLPPGDSASITEGKAIVGDLGAANAKGYIREVATGTAAELGVCHGYIIEDAADSNGEIAVYL
jgi:hypothetical protein